MINITIDWIAITFKEYDNDASQFMAYHALAGKTVSATPRNGYTAAVRDENGVLRMWHNYRPDMGVHVIFAGSALRSIFERSSVQPREILSNAQDLGGRVTRLDLAKDATAEAVNMEKIWNSLEAGKFRGTARKHAQMRGLKAGHTIYIGSRTSERFIRLYDKASEQNIGGLDWKRLELELKGQCARAAATAIVNGEGMSRPFDAHVNDMVKFDNEPEWEKFFPDHDPDFSMPKIEKTTDRETWILSQVVPAVREHIKHVGMSVAIKALAGVIAGGDDIPF